MKKHIKLISILFTCCVLLMACSVNDSTNTDNENVDKEMQNNNEEASENNQEENETNLEENNDSSNDPLSEEHKPNVPDGPNVPDPPEVEGPNVPDLPNIPDFPDVDLPNVDIEGDEDEINMKIPDTLLFNFDESKLKTKAKQTLMEVGTVLEEYNGADVQINGHTDSTGDEDYNINLSEERAESVEEYLDEQGSLDDVSVETKGYGETEPIASNDTDEGQQKNRRVEIVIDNEG